MSVETQQTFPQQAPAPAAGGVPLGAVLMLMAVMGWSFVGAIRCYARPAGGVASGLAAPPVAAVGQDGAEPGDEPPPDSQYALADSSESPEAEADAEPGEDEGEDDGGGDGGGDGEDGGEAAIETEFSKSFTPPEQTEDWAEQLELPKTVKYTVRFGGSLVRVANLFKIYHHEIQALNPGVDPERELPPGTKVVVYKGEGAPGEGGESVDYAGAGSISDPGGIPMVEGPGRIPKATPWKTFAIAETIAVMDLALRRWAKRPGAQKVLVGNMSQRGGGRLKPHSTHQSGRDVDIGYIQKWDGKEELNWRKMNAQNLDPGETWALLQTFVGTGAVEVIFIDRGLQKLLHEYARAQGVTEAALEPWMEYPRRTGEGAPMIQHVAGHDDHIHVRFACPPGQDRCKSRAQE